MQFPRILLLIGIIVIGLVVVVLNALSRNATTSLTSDAAKQPDRIITTTARYPKLFDSNLYYYDSGTNELVVLNIETNTVTRRLQITTLPGTAFTWSPTGLSVLAIDEQQTRLINLVNLSTTTLPPGIHFPIWNPTGDRILYQFFRTDITQNTLAIADPDGTHFTPVLDYPSRLDALWWSNKTQYAIGYDSSSTPPQYLRLLISSKQLVPLGSGSGTGLFSPDGSLFLASGDEDGIIFVANVETGTLQSVATRTSIAKSIWDTNDSFISQTTSGQLVRISALDGSEKRLNDQTTLADNEYIVGLMGQSLVVSNGTVIRIQSLQ